MPRRPGDGARIVKVGLLVVVALVLGAIGLILIGEESSLFSDKNRYNIFFSSVSGINEGNPVQLNGVEVGTIQDVSLPTDPDATEIKVRIEVDEAYAARIREDSEARIKTLGLLGDKYIEIVAGTTDAQVIEPGGTIPTAPATNVDALISSGEDVMANVVQISSSLRDILVRMERGEGLLGELTTDSETGRRVTDSVIETMETVQRTARQLEAGDGLVPRLIHDRALADRVDNAVTELEQVLAEVRGGDGLVPALLNDADTKQRFDDILTQIEATSGELSGFATELREGDGLLPRLMADEELADQTIGEIEAILDRVDRLTLEITEGDGTLARMIEDPSIYEAAQDVILGINESRILRWLIRNRQEKGIETRFEQELQEQGLTPADVELPELPPEGEGDQDESAGEEPPSP